LERLHGAEIPFAAVKPLRIGVLSVQGNFREHAAMLRRLGAEVVEVRKPNELAGLDGLVIPGGESTTFTRLMGLYGLDEAIRFLVASFHPELTDDTRLHELFLEEASLVRT